jgi:hypothetical protein
MDGGTGDETEDTTTGPDPGAVGDTPDADPDAGSPPAATLSRRRVLALTGISGLAGAGFLASRRLLDGREVSSSRSGSSTTGGPATTGDTGATSAPPPADGRARWSDPATWPGGRVPGAGDVATVDKAVLLDVDAEVGGVQVAAGGELVFDPGASRTLSSTGNVTVEGALRMKPADATVEHVLAFDGVDESAFVGDHTHHPLDTDVGTWVTGTGVLDLAGAPKTAWTRATGALAAGATEVVVEEASGWREGDEIVVTPTEPTTVEGYTDHHDRRVVAAVDGTTVTLAEPLEHPHPEITVRDGVTHRAEVLNLTRNVRVEGQPGKRAHVMVLATRPQTISYVGLHHLGPQREEAGVLGRYPLHFHMAGDGVRGSVVEGAVASDGGNHAFVAHLSNGVTFRDCVAHDMAEDPFWWDQGPDEDASAVPSHDITYDRCIAHLVRSAGDGYSLAGFMIGAGAGNVARNCVAVAVMGATESSSGFHWPAGSIDEDHEWVFEDNLVHNSPNTGIYFWQNNVGRTIVDRFTAYHCDFGVLAGSYTNLASYRDNTLYACRSTGLIIGAVPGSDGGDETITYEGMYVDQAGLSDYAVEINAHLVDSGTETRIAGCHFTGGRRAQVALAEPGEFHQLYGFEECTFEGNELWLADDVPPHTTLRIVDAERGVLVVRRADQDGEARPEWNAAVSRV